MGPESGHNNALYSEISLKNKYVWQFLRIKIFNNKKCKRYTNTLQQLSLKARQ